MKKHIAALIHVTIITALLIMATSLHFEGASGLRVEGAITTGTVWTLEDSPIQVYGNVTVTSGATLRIEPGVEIRFETGSSLTVNGSLNAVGTVVNPIKFTSKKHEPAAGDWNGIKFNGDGNSTLNMTFCEVRYATDGVSVASLNKALIENCTIMDNSLSGIHGIGAINLLIRNSAVESNDRGIAASGVTVSGLRIVSSQISNNRDGIYLHAYGQRSRICDVTISNNVIEANVKGICLHSHAKSTTTPTGAGAYINDIAVSSNLLQSNRYGIYWVSEAWGKPGLLGGGAYIYNSVVSQNTIFFSDYAVYIDSTSNWYSWISGLTVAENTIHSSDYGILMHAFRTPKPPCQDVPFDVILVSNVVSANKKKAVIILGDLRVNFTANSVSYNSCGICLNSSVPSENLARNNDIYRNTAYGIHVAEKASIDAEYNYWGDSTGPYHETLNPSGEGDPVNASGENIDLSPFLTEPFGVINHPPSAVLQMIKTTVAVNQTVILDGVESSDDSSLLMYFFDFGDGETAQASQGMVGHKYASIGTYNVSLVVMDDLGVNSTNTAADTVTVTLPCLVVQFSLSQLSVVSGEQVTVTVHVSDGSVGVEEALVRLTSDVDGDFNISSGYTDSNGDFNSTYLAPSVSEPTALRIRITASKASYEKGSTDAYLSVLTPPPSGAESSLMWIGSLTIIIIAAVAIFTLLRRRLKRERMHERENHNGHQDVSSVSMRATPLLLCARIGDMCLCLSGIVISAS